MEPSQRPRLVEPVQRTSLVDAVVDRLSRAILHDELAPGIALPAERQLAEQLGVRRGSLREALKRLEQAGLVEVRHGGGTFVRDWRRTAGLESLPGLLQRPDGGVDGSVVEAVMEMRTALAPDVARQAARRRDELHVQRLLALVDAMTATRVPEGARVAEGRQHLAALAGQLWNEVVDASGNIAYRLAYNALMQFAGRGRALVDEPLAAEQQHVDDFAALALAIRDQDTERAGALARRITERGQAAMSRALEAADAAPLAAASASNEDRP